MKFIATEIPDVVIVEPIVFSDTRGFFMEIYSQKLFAQNGIHVDFVQDNISRSVKGTLRGLHYQSDPHAQAKLVRVIKGAVFDVAVDIRKGSPTFGKWVGIELSEENKKALYIPPGFAHGFYVLTDIAEFTYKCSAFYAPEADRGIFWNDPAIGIEWPIDVSEIITSEKDQNLPLLNDADINYRFNKNDLQQI